MMELNARRLSVCILAVLPSLFFLLAGTGPAGAQAVRPNIVVIMMDDADVGSLDAVIDLGLMPNLETHVIDQGHTFTNAFVTNSLCCPSRATFLTGQYSHNHGVLTNEARRQAQGPDGSVTALDDSSTLATWLQDSGYLTSHIGKYLNGYGYSDLDKDGDLDLDDLLYIPPGWDDWQGLIDFSTYRVYDYRINDNGRIVAHGTLEEDYQTDVLAQRAARFILESEQSDALPFFMAVMPLAPHVEVIPGLTSFDQLTDAWRWDIRPAPRHLGSITLPLPRPPSFNELNVTDKPLWLQLRPRLSFADILYLTRQYRHRLESLRAVDDLLGTVVAALQDAGELDSTVIIFTSDNGFLYGEHRLPEKLYAYEEAIRVPLYVRTPQSLVPGQINHFVLNNDLAPTIADLAGATPGLDVDGVSFVPLLDDPDLPQWRLRFLIEHWSVGSIFDLPHYAAVRTHPDQPTVPNLLYLAYENQADRPEFYDLTLDPFQLTSLHASTNVLRTLQREILADFLPLMKSCAGASCRALEFCTDDICQAQ